MPTVGIVVALRESNKVMTLNPGFLAAKPQAMPTKTQLETVFHPSDFTAASEVAFIHALKLALESKAMLQMMHVDDSCMAEWDDFPSVSETLIRWNVLPEGSGRSEVAELDMRVSKVIASSKDRSRPAQTSSR